MAMHGLEYCATASSSNMADMIRKIEKARQAVQCNLFPLWEKDENGFTINYVNKSPLTVREFVSGIGKFGSLTEEDIDALQKLADERYETVERLAGN